MCAGGRLEARPRLASVPAAPPRRTRLPSARSPTSSRRRRRRRRSRHACARSRATPRRAPAARQVPRASVRRRRHGDGAAAGRRRGGGHLRRKYRQMQALGRAPRLHCWTRAPATSGLTRNRRAEKVSGAGSAPGFPVSSLSLCTPAAPELRRPLGVRPGLGPSSAPGSQVTSPSPRGRRWHFTLYWKAGNNLALPASAHSPHRPHRHCC